MLTRKIPLNYRNVTGVASSLPGGEPTPFESPLERDFIQLLRFGREVVEAYQSQRPIILYKDENGAKRRYTPDLFVTYCGGRKVMYEVKPRDVLWKNWSEFKPKFRAAIRYGKERGYFFKIMTDVEIRTIFLKNVKFLSSFRRSEEYDPRYRVMINTLSMLGSSTPQELVDKLAKSKYEKAELLHTLWRLVADKIVGVDLDEELSMNSPIWYQLDASGL